MDVSRVIKQYKTTNNFKARVDFWEKYNVNPVTWTEFVFNNIMEFGLSNILEVGCGIGQIWFHNPGRVRKNQKIILSDFSEGMITEAQNRLKDRTNFEFKVFTVNSIPYNDSFFSGVIANHMMYHIEDIPSALHEINRVLSSDGIFFISTNTRAHRKEMIEIIDRGINGNFDNVSMRFNEENGKKYLENEFNIKNEKYYTNKIKIDDCKSFLDYIFSISFIQDLTDEKKEDLISHIVEYFNENKICEITQEFVLFVCSKK